MMLILAMVPRSPRIKLELVYVSIWGELNGGLSARVSRLSLQGWRGRAIYAKAYLTTDALKAYLSTHAAFLFQVFYDHYYFCFTAAV